MKLYHQQQRLVKQRNHCRVRSPFIYVLILVIFLPFFILCLKRAFYKPAGPPDFQTQKNEQINTDLQAFEGGFLFTELEGPMPSLSFSSMHFNGAIKEGESIYQCLHQKGVSDRNIQMITHHLTPLLSFRYQSQPGDTYHLSLSADGEIERFEYQKSPTEIYCLTREGDNTWNAWREKITLTKYWTRFSGEINGSLVSTFQEKGYPVSLALQCAEILEWKIDFQHEVREGDRFSVVIEKFFKEEKEIGYGRILAVHYDGQVTGRINGFYFDPGGRKGDYYDPDGVSLRRAFLRAPLSYKYISSGFSYHRKHPILGNVRPHLAIDFAAPQGSPIWAVADGTILSRSYDKNNGNQVKIKHMNGYITYYNHLSRFAKGIRRGVRVAQKQIIGYVGTTGLSTGPHLDYRVKKDGRFINPLKGKYPSGKPIQKSCVPEFKKVIAKIIPFMQGPEEYSRLRIAEIDSSEVSLMQTI